MKDSRNSGGKNHVYVNHWERMTPSEQRYEREHGFSGNDWANVIIIVCIVLMILNAFSSCGK